MMLFLWCDHTVYGCDYEVRKIEETQVKTDTVEFLLLYFLLFPFEKKVHAVPRSVAN